MTPAKIVKNGTKSSFFKQFFLFILNTFYDLAKKKDFFLSY